MPRAGSQGRDRERAQISWLFFRDAPANQNVTATLPQRRLQFPKSKVEESLTELADFFSGEKTLTRVGRDAQLREWFLRLAEQVRSLASSDSTATGRKVHHLITALSEVEQFHQIESALQLKQFLAEARRPDTAGHPRRRGGVTRPPSLPRRCARCSSV